MQFNRHLQIIEGLDIAPQLQRYRTVTLPDSLILNKLGKYPAPNTEIPLEEVEWMRWGVRIWGGPKHGSWVVANPKLWQFADWLAIESPEVYFPYYGRGLCQWLRENKNTLSLATVEFERLIGLAVIQEAWNVIYQYRNERLRPGFNPNLFTIAEFYIQEAIAIYADWYEPTITDHLFNAVNTVRKEVLPDLD